MNHLNLLNHVWLSCARLECVFLSASLFVEVTAYLFSVAAKRDTELLFA
jgi:hypothetical protein